MTYFANQEQGIFVFTDHQGYFNLFKKKTVDDKETGELSHQIIFFKRVHSDFEDIQIIKQQMYLTLYARGASIGFVRAFDGEKGISNCTLNTTQIIDLDFDKQRPGVFYALTNDSSILMVQAKTKSANEVYCEEYAKISTIEEENNKLLVLPKMIIAYSTNTEYIQVFNITEEVKPGAKELRGTSLKMKHKKGQIVVDKDQLILNPSEERDSLILVDIIDSTYIEDPWYLTYLGNKGLVFTVIIMIVVAYQLMKSKTTSDEDNESEEFRSIKNLLQKNNNTIDGNWSIYL